MVDFTKHTCTLDDQVSAEAPVVDPLPPMVPAGLGVLHGSYQGLAAARQAGASQALSGTLSGNDK